MKIRPHEDYYFWCCDWCDSENLVLLAQLPDGTNCGACHRPMNLPAMNGVDLCREVHKDWPWSITIAVTGYASLFDLVKCREAGFEDYFIKPVESKQLLEAAGHAFKKLDRWKHRPGMPRREAVFKMPESVA